MRRLPVLLLALVVVGLRPDGMHAVAHARDRAGERRVRWARQQHAVVDRRSQNYIISRLKGYGATGLNSTATGDDRFRQPFTAGTNIVGIIPGTELPNEYVIVGGHYDHLGSACRGSGAVDAICNGATDNGAGVAATIEVGHAIADLPGGPRRSVVIALWDGEEDGLLGSAYYTQHPLVPLAQTIAYVNFDIQGANLLPSLRSSSFAVGAETGGARLRERGDDGGWHPTADPSREFDFRPGPERLRQLHERRRSQRVLQRLHRSLLPHRRRRGRRGRLREAGETNRRSRRRSPKTSSPVRLPYSCRTHRPPSSPMRSSCNRS